MPDHPADENTQEGGKTSPDGPGVGRGEAASNPVAEGTPPIAPPRTEVGPVSELVSTNVEPRTSSGTTDFDRAIDPVEAALHIRPGIELFDDYVVESKLGEGGMGSVWKVRNIGLGASTALKVIIETNFTDEARERLKREAMLMAQIKHPNAVVVHRSKVRREVAFIEMEYLKGESIDRMLLRGRPMELGWTARILEQLCGVLEYAHERVVDEKGRPVKIVHRDLKPSNLMILEDHTGGPYFLKVLDFGIAKKVDSEAADAAEFKTGTGGALFTLPYASPEQIGGKKDISEKSDIYSVGVMLYEFLTGYRPFNEPGLIYGHLCLDPPPFATSNPEADVPPAIEAIVMRCLAKDPNARPTARELVRDFILELPPDMLLPRTTTGRYTGEYTRPAVTERNPPDSLSESSYRRATLLETQRPGTTPSGYDRTEVGTSRSWRDEKGTSKSGKQQVRASPGGGRKPPVLAILLGIVGCLAIAGLGLYIARPGGDKPPNSTNPEPVKSTEPVAQPTPPKAQLIPAGYEPVLSLGEIDGHPRVIQRKGTPYKFIYMPGRQFKLGCDPKALAYTDRFRGEDPDKAPPDLLKDDRHDDRPERDVMISSFYIQETEVTNCEIHPYFADKPNAVKDRWERSLKDHPLPTLERKPAVFITKEAARAYAKSVGGDLPSEAQWEFAARSGERNYRPYVWDRSEDTPMDFDEDINVGVVFQGSNLKDVFESKHDETIQKVRGLMGNAREWCLDDWAPYPRDNSAARLHPPRDPVHLDPASKEGSVVRGGSFRTLAERCQTTWPRRIVREMDKKTYEQVRETGASEDIGFRVVLKVPEAS